MRDAYNLQNGVAYARTNTRQTVAERFEGNSGLGLALPQHAEDQWLQEARSRSVGSWDKLTRKREKHEHRKKKTNVGRRWGDLKLRDANTDFFTAHSTVLQGRTQQPRFEQQLSPKFLETTFGRAVLHMSNGVLNGDAGAHAQSVRLPLSAPNAAKHAPCDDAER